MKPDAFSGMIERETIMTATTTEPREAARAWIASTLTKHLRADLAGGDRIRSVAAEIEQTAYEQNMAVEVAVQLAGEWADDQNERAAA